MAWIPERARAAPPMPYRVRSAGRAALFLKQISTLSVDKVDIAKSKCSLTILEKGAEYLDVVDVETSRGEGVRNY